MFNQKSNAFFVPYNTDVCAIAPDHCVYIGIENIEEVLKIIYKHICSYLPTYSELYINDETVFYYIILNNSLSIATTFLFCQICIKYKMSQKYIH